MKTVYYIAVRENTEDKHTWYDTSTISLLLEQSQKWAAENEQKLSDFYKVHPVIRFTQVELHEIK